MPDTARPAAPSTHADLAAELLPDDLLATIRERAAAHDRDNTFFDDDLAALRERGYLRLLVPTAMGGLGASVQDAARLQRRLAQAAPATALGINMHLVVTGAALVALHRGLDAARGILEDAARDRLFAFGISEGGNDAMLFDSFTRAERTDAGLALSGTKIFTSMAPAWDRLVVHAKLVDEQGELPPVGEGELVFGTLARERGGDGALVEAPGVETLDDWDTHGMRASQSRTTRLTGTVLAPEAELTRMPAGPGPNPFAFGIFGVFEILLAAVYTGIGERAVQIAAGIATSRRSRTAGIAFADDPAIRWRLADAAIELDGAILQIERIAADLDALRADAPTPGATDHGPRFFLHFSGVKHRATEAALHAVDEALRSAGGAHYSRGGELERISRDVRAGLYQPSDAESVHASYARALLGEVGAER